MGSPRSKVSWTGTAASLALALAAIAAVPSGGCSTIPTQACGEEPAAGACGRLGYECGKVVVCYSCGVAKRLDCGACADTQTCGGGGTPHVCWPPLSDGGGEGGAAGDDGGASEAGASGDADTSDAPASDALVSGDADDGSAGDADTGEASASDAAPTDAASDGAIEGGAPGDAGDTTTVVECPDDAVPPEDAP